MNNTKINEWGDGCLSVGFARIDITPPLGVNIPGYFPVRLAEKILDPLEINAVAIEKEGKKVVVLVVDDLHIPTAYASLGIKLISEKTGIDQSAIFIHSTHTHTGALLNIEENLSLDVDKEHSKIVLRKLVDASVTALEDLTPAKMGFAITKAEKVAFNRRYLMKDGTTQTNPGVNNPNIEKSIGLLDERLNVLRFERSDGQNIVVGNMGNHPDTVGGNVISADWIGLARGVFERAVEKTKCVIINGAQGDINHINTMPVGGEYNGLTNDFDNVPRGYTHTKHIANVIAGAIMQIYEKVEFVPVGEIDYAAKVIEVPTNMPKPEEMAEAYYIKKLVDEGKTDQLPYKGMLLTTHIADAMRKIRLEKGPEFKPMRLSALRIGNVGLLGVPGEPFAGIGIGIKQTEGFDMIMPCCLTNGSEGYFPMQDSYDEGGYEAKSSNYKAGIAELLIKEGKSLLTELKK